MEHHWNTPPRKHRNLRQQAPSAHEAKYLQIERFSRLAEDWLRGVIDEARRGTLPGMVKTGVSTYRSLLGSQILPRFAELPIESITPAMIESWIASVDRAAATRVKLLAMVHGVFQRARKVWGLQVNPVVDVEKPPLGSSGDIEVFSPEEIWALERAAASERDSAIFLTAAFTGLRRGELLALHWRDVDFAGSVIRVRASYHEGVLSTPKSGKVRSVPMAPSLAAALAKLGDRGTLIGDDDLVFLGEEGGYVDGSALRRRYDAAIKRAGLRRLRFHDLRHTFGTRMIAKADIGRVQEWMGHADIQTTMKYLHYAPRAEDARLVAEAFALQEPLAQQVCADT